MQKLMKIHYETIKIILCFVVLIVNNLSTLKQYYRKPFAMRFEVNFAKDASEFKTQPEQ